MPSDCVVQESKGNPCSKEQEPEVDPKEVNEAAYYLSCYRAVKGIPGTPQEDWNHERERLVLQRRMFRRLGVLK
jgi:hypothetical protein